MTKVVERRAHPALVFAAWPLPDREAWQAALRVPDFLADGGRGAEWRPASRRSGLGVYARWLAWLTGQGVDLAAEPPAGRITPNRMRAYVVFLQQGRCAVTVASYLSHFCMTVAAMFPGQDWRWLRRLHAALRRQARTSQRKRKPLVPAEQLVQLGLDLLGQAGAVLDRQDDGVTTSRQMVAAARDYRDGLLIALLALRPLRLKNLLQIELGRQLRQAGGQITLTFRASEMKTHRPYEVEWPALLAPALSRYLDQVRPLLIAARAPGGLAHIPYEPGTRLWVGQGATPFTPAGLTKALARHTSRRFGQRITAHRFRHCVASTQANRDLRNIRYAGHLLAHASLRTTERNYIVANSAAALDGYHDLIQAMRAAAAATTSNQESGRR
jgi:integrase/recombinase XerD